MKRRTPTRWRNWLATLALLLGTCTPSFAGWMGFRNDTERTIMIQETVIVNGQTRLSKLLNLFKNDVSTDGRNCPNGIRKFDFYEPGMPNKLIHSQSFPCPKSDENIIYSIQDDPKTGIKIVPVKVDPPAPK